MALRIRLRRQGKKNNTFYRIVVTDSRNPRDGKYVESVGWYNPCESVEERHLLVKPDRLKHWLDNGASLTEKAEAIVNKAAPAVVKEHNKKLVESKLKATKKRRELRKKKK